jgi:Ser-tRNA(Ala) deacylase AlaX
MTEKLFWQDPYQSSLDTRLTRIEADRVQLQQTIFYAQSGGQESDAGSIAGRKVVLAQKCGQEIEYTLEDVSGLAVGDPVRVEIDAQRRYALMRLHFAAELVLELVCRLQPGIEKIGAHIAADKARIDFIHAQNISPLFAAIETEVARIVAAGLPIRSEFSDRQGERRYWQIEGVAQVPCGGTHLRNSAEVGALHLKRKNIGQGKERIEITLSPALPPG